MKPETLAIRDQIDRTAYREHSTPLFMTSSFVYHSAEHAELMFSGSEEGDIYSRFTNPNTTELINKYCSLEKAEAGVCTASGMSAIFTTLSALLGQGDEVVACEGLFGNTNYILKNVLPKWGIKTTFVSLKEPIDWESAITSQTKLVFIETPTNPGLNILDVEEIGRICKKNDAIFCVDNCFATPFLQQPILMGADLCLHSATKWIDGQGRTLGGIIVGKQNYVDIIFDFLRRTGACLSPFNAWLLSKSTETLAIRMEKHCSNALKLAQFLQNHDFVDSVKYPFLESHPQYGTAKRQMRYGGGIVTFSVKGNKEKTFEFINRLKIPTITANLGDSRTIVTHPSTTTHRKLTSEEKQAVGISDSTIRTSVGLESIDDIILDFDQALKTVG